MKTILTTLLSLLFVLTASADIAIYKISGYAIALGGTSQSYISNAFTGFLLMDRDGNVVIMPANKKTREYLITRDGGYQVTHVTRFMTTYTIIDQAKATPSDSDPNKFDIETGKMKGVEAEVEVGTTAWWDLPKTMTYTGTSTYPRGPVSTTVDEKGSLTLDMARSRTSNKFNDNMEAAIVRCAVALEAAGYKLKE